MCVCMEICAGEYRHQTPLEQDLQVAVSYLARVLGSQLRSSARAVRALNRRACLWLVGLRMRGCLTHGVLMEESVSFSYEEGLKG